MDELISREVAISSTPAVMYEWRAAGLRRMHLRVPPTVYPPRIDTTLLDRCIGRIGGGGGRRMLEIGCGSGAISIAAAQRGWQVTACDVNPLAVAATKGNAIEYNIEITTVEGGIDLNDSGEVRMTPELVSLAPYHLIVWNLPYLDPPSVGEARLGPLEDAGLVDLKGEEGWSDKLLRVLGDIPELLADGGTVHLIHTSSKRGRMLQNRWRKGGFATRIAEQMTLGDGEVLTCVSAWRPWQGRKMTVVGEVDSTNRALLDAESVIGDCLVAVNQAAGRGQRGRSWYSETGDFTGSWLLDEENVLASATLTQVRAALAVVDSVRLLQDRSLASVHWAEAGDSSEKSVAIRWPNDVWVGGGKLSGCLVEGRQTGSHQKVVLGIGVNLVEKTGVNFPAISIPQIVNMDITMEEYSRILDTSVSSLFESGPLLPASRDQIPLLWQLMANSLSNGLSILRDGTPHRQCGLAEGGVAVITDDRLVEYVTDSFELTWR